MNLQSKNQVIIIISIFNQLRSLIILIICFICYQFLVVILRITLIAIYYIYYEYSKMGLFFSSYLLADFSLSSNLQFYVFLKSRDFLGGAFHALTIDLVLYSCDSININPQTLYCRNRVDQQGTPFAKNYKVFFPFKPGFLGLKKVPENSPFSEWEYTADNWCFINPYFQGVSNGTLFCKGKF